MKKVGIVLTSLSTGGAQRSGAILSQLLVNEGYDISVVITQKHVDYEYAGELYCVYDRAYHKNKVIRAFRTFTTFKNIITSNAFDCIIDGRHRATWLKQRFITSFIYGKVPVIYVVHSYNLSDYLPRKKWMVNNIYKKAAKVVGVSEGICQMIKGSYGLENVIKISNTIYQELLLNQASKQLLLVDSLYILYYGRFQESEKNISFLIHAYANSLLPKKNIRLVLLGNGNDELYYKSLVEDLGCKKNVVFMDFNKNPFSVVQNALFIVLTSNYEGFPMVLIESLMLGTPVVSVDCPSGPSEVIKTGFNGILTPQNDQKAFVAALNKMISDKKFYDNCKENAVRSVSHLTPENIGKQWRELLDEILK